MTIVDARQRLTAIDPTRSFCVSAPAGSGKTELLIQRYLGLLSRVERPEQVLAITFTRKAAAEMRERVVAALQGAIDGSACGNPHQRQTRELAEQALAADTASGWHLVRDISRLNIKTIDSFCGGLTRQMPVLSEFGGQASPVDDAGELYDEAVHGLFRALQQTDAVYPDLAALMLHFDNNWERLRDLLVALLARRDQWRGYVGVHRAPAESEAYLVATVNNLVREELVDLAATLAPCGEELLDLQCYAAAHLGNPAPRAFPGSEPDQVGAWRSLLKLLLTGGGTWRRRLTVAEGFPPGKGEAQARKEQLKALIGRLAAIEGLEQRLAAVDSLPEMAPGSNAWQLLVHLSRLLPRLAAELLLVFQRHGAVDHTQVALSALQALGEDDAPTELALRLDYRIDHILVDEFQDTSVNQYELLHCLTRGWGEYNAVNPQAPRTVMIVGDGMQSIYGFRGANVGLFLRARNHGFNGVRLEHLELESNFRSDRGLVDWVNGTFARAFPSRDDIGQGQVSYTPATAVRPEAARPAVEMHAFHGEGALSGEVDFICREIAAALDDPTCRSIAVLGRSRGQLRPILDGLRRSGIRYSAQDLGSLAESPAVADLYNLCRALANGADRLAWMALLRAPWCGLSLGDLLEIGRWGEEPRYTPVWPSLGETALLRRLSPDGGRRLARIRPVLARAHRQRDRLALRVWIEQVWLDLEGPACVTDQSQLADVESFLQLLEQADEEGIGLDTDWLARRLEKQFMNPGDGDGRVQVMTLHKAKGLEFDRVVIPQLARVPRAEGRQLLLWDEHSGPGGERAFLLAADDHSAPGEPTLYNYLQRQRDEKALLEGTRLLYVGSTRAVGRLLLTTSLVRDDNSGEFRPPPARSLLRCIWPTFSAAMTVHEPVPDRQPPASDPGDRLLLRLCLEGVAAPTDTVTDADRADPNIPERPVNHVERSVGTVVHLALETLSRRDPLPRAVGDGERRHWRQALQRCGLWGGTLERALAAVEKSVSLTLDAEQGRWILSAQHREAHSEWALTGVGPDGGLRELVIDRTFLDPDSGLRWIIDYKTSRPEGGEPLETFLSREAETYRSQLALYRDTLATLCAEPLRCALYFTGLGHLHRLPELDWNPSIG